MLILGIVIVFFAIVLLIIGNVLENESNSFEKNKRYGKAEVVGYEHADKSDWYTLLVRIPELNDGKIYNCKSSKGDVTTFPKGTFIDVIYAPMKSLGISIIEVHLLDNPPADSLKIGKIIKKVSIIMLVLGVVLTVMGLL